jgi:hypothetical protein
MVTAGTQLGVMLYPDYDVASRTIQYHFGSYPGVVFTLRVGSADQDPNGFGFRGFDGTSLESGIRFSFRTSLEQPTPNPDEARAPVPDCGQVVSVLANAGCARTGCHSRKSSPQCTGGSPMAWDEGTKECVSVPRMGLLLDDAHGLLTTAINHVAHETQSGTDISRRFESARRFGDQMPLIDPQQPENSYLIYKLLIGERFNRELDERADPSDPLSPSGLTKEQIGQARDWFIRFGPMPPDEVGAPRDVSLFETYQLLSRWIRSGAVCP